MAELNDLIQQIQNIRQQLQQALPDIALANTVIAKALVERKIRNIGFGVKYSNNRVPAWFFLGKELNGTGKAFLAAKIKKDELETHTQDGVKYYGEENGITWAQFRQAQGLPVDHVNLSYTNKMWAGIGPQQPYFENGVIICPLGGNTVEVVNKLNWNRDRYGDFFGKVLGKDEVQILTVAVVERVNQIFIDNGFKQ